MPRVILQPDQFKRLLRRRAMGGDRHDEVWNGVYVMSPLADNEHQTLGFELAFMFKQAGVGGAGTRIFPGTNVRDRVENWRKNDRCPDVAVFLPGNPAEDRGSPWLGSPDFAVEILSRGDHSRKKFEVYGVVGVRELLIVDRRPWRLELYRHNGGGWTLVGTSTVAEPEVLASEVLSLSFRMLTGERRPWIEMTRSDGRRPWII